MSDLRTAAQQALDSINELFAAEQSEGGERGGHIRTPATREHLVRVAQARRALHESCDTLRAVLAQQAEPTGKESLQVESVVAENATTQQQLADAPPSDYRRGYWGGFNIGKREGRIEAEDALAQQAEPEPVAWMCPDDPERETAFSWKAGHCENCGKQRIPLYTAPPQRKPLTDEEEE